MLDKEIHKPRWEDAITQKRIAESHIIVVDDDKTSLSLLQHTFAKHHFTNVAAFTSGQQALDYCRFNTPDLIIIDLLMPGMTGFDLCQELRKLKSLNTVPIFAYTALENPHQRISVFDLGASDVLHKPVMEDELVARCKLHLERRHILRDLHAYRDKVNQDLTLAREMQNLLMPDAEAIAAMEAQYQVEISTYFEPSLLIGGDFWGATPIDANRFMIFTGDFTGHGVTAAINVFRFYTLREKMNKEIWAAPSYLLNIINRRLFDILPVELFATVFYGVVDKEKNELAYTLAGSPSPLILRACGKVELVKGKGLPLAAVQSPGYKTHTVPFYSGDTLVMYTDALIEAKNEQGDFLEIEKLGESLLDLPEEQRSARNIQSHIYAYLSDFTDDAWDDDLTITVCHRKE